MGVRANAQVVVDNSLGNAGALNGPNFKIPETLGKTVGDNLFHSFSEFSLQSGQSATFTGPDSIQNILGRVTGAKVSEIDGLIKSEITDANLYLLNPNGFLFGNNAKVDVDGAFTLSTRESLKLGEDGSFNAVNPDRSVFTTAAPNAFGFLGDNPGGAIKFSGTKLIVENPVGLVGGDIRLDDAVIYSKSEGKPTGVSIEGGNLSVVDSQIRNKSTLEVEGVQQGIKIELSGDLEITDTTITEADGSGVDRGDFIDEIGSDVPFSSRVGLLGITEGFENPDPIAIKAKDATITGGGVYSVNVVTGDQILGKPRSSDIQINAANVSLSHGTIRHGAKIEVSSHTDVTNIDRSTFVVKPSESPFSAIDSAEMYVNGTRVFEGVDFELKYNSSGKFLRAVFYENLPKGTEVKIITRPSLSLSATDTEFNIKSNAELDESFLSADRVHLSTGDLLLENSQIETQLKTEINARGSVSLMNNSLVKADMKQTGEVAIVVDALTMEQSGLSAGDEIVVQASGEVSINDDSVLSVGWENTALYFEDLHETYWDSESGEIFNEYNVLYPVKLKNAGDVLDYLSVAHQIPKSEFNLVDINQPYQFESFPRISISGSEVRVKDGLFDSRAFGNPSSLRVNSKGLIRITGDSDFNRFSQVELTSKNVEMLKGVKYNSSVDLHLPIESMIIRSEGSTELKGVNIGSSLIVYAGEDLLVEDAVLNSSALKLKANNDFSIGPGELGIVPHVESKRMIFNGGVVDIRSTGLKSSMGVGIFASEKVKINGPTRIQSFLGGEQAIMIDAPVVELNEGTEIEGTAYNFAGNTGSMVLKGDNELSLKGVTMKLFELSPQNNSESPSIELYGQIVNVDNSKLFQFAYYNPLFRKREAYGRHQTKLSGIKLTKIVADQILNITNETYIYTNNGNIDINAETITVDNSKIASVNTWPASSVPASFLRLNADADILLKNASICGYTLSDQERMNVFLNGDRLISENSLLGIVDQRDGAKGRIDLNFNGSVKMDNSQVVSIGEAQLTPDTNGNDINVSSSELVMNNSLVGGFVQGRGRRGVTTLDVAGDISLSGSYIGGLDNPLSTETTISLSTDGTISSPVNLEGVQHVTLSPNHGKVVGSNLFHSINSLELDGNQSIVLDVPENIENVFVRITDGKTSRLNGTIKSTREEVNVILINEKGFELGPDAQFESFSGIVLGAVDAIKLDDGKSFGIGKSLNAELSDGDPIYNMAPNQLTGIINMYGTSLSDNSLDAKSTSISLLAETLKMKTSTITTINGADINLQANSIDMRRFSNLDAISPNGGIGGDINVLVNELYLNEAGMRTTSVGGAGGDVNVQAIKINTTDMHLHRFTAENHYAEGVTKYYKTGDVNISAEESFINHRLFVATQSYTPGGAGDIYINAGEFVGDGPDWFGASEIWSYAYEGKSGEINIRADSFDAKQIRINNVALNDSGFQLDKSEGSTYGDITIDANDINLDRFMAFTSTSRINDPFSICNVNINAENNILINQILIYPSINGAAPHPVRAGMGGDLTITAKNILSTQDLSTFDPIYSPTIGSSGRIRFHAKEDLELGIMRFIPGNYNPNRDIVHEFKGQNIKFGIKTGDEFISSNTVVFDYENNSTRNNRIKLVAENEIHLVSGVGLNIPTLSLDAENFYVNNSYVSMGGTFGSDLSVRNDLILSEGSFIKSISGHVTTGPDQVALDIASNRLTLEGESYILTANEGSIEVGAGNPDLHIDTQFLSIQDGGVISTESINGDDAGDLVINAHKIRMDSGAQVGSFNYGSGKSGDIAINAIHLTLSGEASIDNGFDFGVLENKNLFPFVSGDAGDITLRSETLSLESGSLIRNAQIDTALPGDLNITSDKVSLAGGSFIATESVPLYQSDLSNRTEVDQNGSVNIKTGSLTLSDSSYVKTTTVIPKRNAGDITVEADTVSLTGRSSMLSNTEPNKFEAELSLTGLDYGNAGRLAINSHTVHLSDQSKISSDSFTSGDGGDVSITSSDLALAKRSAIYAGALGQGQGGRIAIDTTLLNLSGKSAVVADVRDSGNGGEVTVKAATLEMAESLIYGSTSGAGEGSRISVEAESVALQNGARIESAASAAGAAGALDVRSGIVTIRGTGEGFDPKDIEGGETGEEVASGLLTSTVGSGNAGTIELNADHLEMQQGLIGSASTGTGTAGSVGLRLAKGLSLGQGARVSVSSSQADGGDIDIETAGEVSLAKSELTASAAKDGGSIRLLGTGNRNIRDSRLSAEAGQDGGNITISKPGLLFMNRGQLTANAVHGDGGYISVVADTFLPSLDSLITASSEYGAQGVVEIDSVETDIGGGLVVLPDQLKDRSVNLAERCALQLQGDVSSFFINGQGGLPVWTRENYLPTLLDNESK